MEIKVRVCEGLLYAGMRLSKESREIDAHVLSELVSGMVKGS